VTCDLAAILVKCRHMDGGIRGGQPVSEAGSLARTLLSGAYRLLPGIAMAIAALAIVATLVEVAGSRGRSPASASSATVSTSGAASSRAGVGSASPAPGTTGPGVEADQLSNGANAALAQESNAASGGTAARPSNASPAAAANALSGSTATSESPASNSAAGSAAGLSGSGAMSDARTSNGAAGTSAGAFGAAVGAGAQASRSGVAATATPIPPVAMQAAPPSGGSVRVDGRILQPSPDLDYWFLIREPGRDGVFRQGPAILAPDGSFTYLLSLTPLDTGPDAVTLAAVPKDTSLAWTRQALSSGAYLPAIEVRAENGIRFLLEVRIPPKT